MHINLIGIQNEQVLFCRLTLSLHCGEADILHMEISWCAWNIPVCTLSEITRCKPKILPVQSGELHTKASRDFDFLCFAKRTCLEVGAMWVIFSHISKQQQDVARPCSVGELRSRQEKDSSYNTAKPPAIIKGHQSYTSPEYISSQCSYEKLKYIIYILAKI